MSAEKKKAVAILSVIIGLLFLMMIVAVAIEKNKDKTKIGNQQKEQTIQSLSEVGTDNKEDQGENQTEAENKKPTDGGLKVLDGENDQTQDDDDGGDIGIFPAGAGMEEQTSKGSGANNEGNGETDELEEDVDWSEFY